MLSCGTKQNRIRKIAHSPRLNLSYGVRLDGRKDLLYFKQMDVKHIVINREFIGDELITYVDKHKSYGGLCYTQMKKWYFDENIEEILKILERESDINKYGNIQLNTNEIGLKLNVDSSEDDLDDVDIIKINLNNMIELIDIYLNELRTECMKPHIHDDLLFYKIFSHLPMEKGILFSNAKNMYSSMCFFGRDVFNYLSKPGLEYIESDVESEQVYIF